MSRTVSHFGRPRVRADEEVSLRTAALANISGRTGALDLMTSRSQLR